MVTKASHPVVQIWAEYSDWCWRLRYVLWVKFQGVGCEVYKAGTIVRGCLFAEKVAGVGRSLEEPVLGSYAVYIVRARGKSR